MSANTSRFPLACVSQDERHAGAARQRFCYASGANITGVMPRAPGVRPRPLRAARAAVQPEAIRPPSSGQQVGSLSPCPCAQVTTKERSSTTARTPEGASRGGACEASPWSPTSRSTVPSGNMPTVAGMPSAPLPEDVRAPYSEMLRLGKSSVLAGV